MRRIGREEGRQAINVKKKKKNKTKLQKVEKNGHKAEVYHLSQE